MKQINDLIICTVPKDARDFSVLTVGEQIFPRYIVGNMITFGSDHLPPGQYEIIGLYSENPMTDRMGVTAKLTALKAADRRSAPYDVAWRFRELQDEYQLQPTDTNDLLFIHKLK